MRATKNAPTAENLAARRTDGVRGRVRERVGAKNIALVAP